MSRRINKIELICLTIASGKGERNTLRLNGNTTLSLNVHAIQHLSGHLSVGQATAELNKPISNSGFPMINMGNN